MIYLINDERVSKDYFFSMLNLCVFTLTPCCIYQIKNEERKFRKIKSQLLDGSIKIVDGVKFQIIDLLKLIY